VDNTAEISLEVKLPVLAWPISTTRHRHAFCNKT